MNCTVLPQLAYSYQIRSELHSELAQLKKDIEQNLWYLPFRKSFRLKTSTKYEG